MIKLYLDNCIFVADFDKKEEKHNIVTKTLDKLSKCNRLVLVTSDFTFTEIVKVLVREKQVNPKEAHEYVAKTYRASKIQGVPFKILKTEGRVPKGKIFDFHDFFLAIQDELLNSKYSISDAIHIVIMKNNNVNRILTFDSDFENDEEIEKVDPRKIDDFLKRVTS
jgi:predicted nucleic acid-binding protein